MTTIVHCSDTHGHFPELRGDIDLIVHSGDFLPNRTFGMRAIEEAFQPLWIEQNAAKLHRWTRARPLLLTRGNHDFIDVVAALNAIGIEAYSLDDRRFVHSDIVFYGFPHVPWFGGGWNFECSDRELEARTNAIDMEGVNVLVAHSPMYGVLDRNDRGERCGSIPMRQMLQDSPHVPEWFLCGHIHEAAGVQGWSRGIKISNAATTQRLIHLT